MPANEKPPARPVDIYLFFTEMDGIFEDSFCDAEKTGKGICCPTNGQMCGFCYCFYPKLFI